MKKIIMSRDDIIKDLEDNLTKQEKYIKQLEFNIIDTNNLLQSYIDAWNENGEFYKSDLAFIKINLIKNLNLTTK